MPKCLGQGGDAAADVAEADDAEGEVAEFVAAAVRALRALPSGAACSGAEALVDAILDHPDDECAESRRGIW